MQYEMCTVHCVDQKSRINAELHAHFEELLARTMHCCNKNIDRSCLNLVAICQLQFYFNLRKTILCIKERLSQLDFTVHKFYGL